jgi:hypothetical protein
MQGPDLRQLGRGMGVYDANGDRLGAIAQVYRRRPVMAGPGRGRPVPGEVLEIKTGFLGLGGHLYVPLRAVREAAPDRVSLWLSRAEIEAAGWDARPPRVGESI